MRLFRHNGKLRRQNGKLRRGNEGDLCCCGCSSFIATASLAFDGVRLVSASYDGTGGGYDFWNPEVYGRNPVVGPEAGSASPLYFDKSFLLNADHFSSCLLWESYCGLAGINRATAWYPGGESSAHAPANVVVLAQRVTFGGVDSIAVIAFLAEFFLDSVPVVLFAGRAPFPGSEDDEVVIPNLLTTYTDPTDGTVKWTFSQEIGPWPFSGYTTGLNVHPPTTRGITAGFNGTVTLKFNANAETMGLEPPGNRLPTLCDGTSPSNPDPPSPGTGSGPPATGSVPLGPATGGTGTGATGMPTGPSGSGTGIGTGGTGVATGPATGGSGVGTGGSGATGPPTTGPGGGGGSGSGGTPPGSGGSGPCLTCDTHRILEHANGTIAWNGVTYANGGTSVGPFGSAGGVTLSGINDSGSTQTAVYTNANGSLVGTYKCGPGLWSFGFALLIEGGYYDVFVQDQPGTSLGATVDIAAAQAEGRVTADFQGPDGYYSTDIGSQIAGTLAISVNNTCEL